MSAVGVFSETDQLRKVIVHRPEVGPVDAMGDHREQIQAKKARNEHDTFTDVLRSYGVEVLYLDTLLEQTIGYPDARDWLLDRRLPPKRLGPDLTRDVRAWLNELPSKELAILLTSGMTLDKLPIKPTDPITAMLEPDTPVLLPLPKQIFTQDTSSWIFDGVSLNFMGSLERQGESDNVAAIYHFHPTFEATPFKFWWGLDREAYGSGSLHGCDILVLRHGVIAIATGDHTTPQAVTELARALISHAGINEVIVVKIPAPFKQIHLDVAFSMCGPDLATVCKPIADAITCYSIRMIGPEDRLIIQKLQEHFVEVMRRALGLKKLRTITMEPYDNSNTPQGGTLVIKPNVVASYKSNIQINARLRAAGVDVVIIDASILCRDGSGPQRLVCTIRRDLPASHLPLTVINANPPN